MIANKVAGVALALVMAVPACSLMYDIRALSPAQQWDLAYGTYVNVHEEATRYARAPSVSLDTKRRIVDALDEADEVADPIIASAKLLRDTGATDGLGQLADRLNIIADGLRKYGGPK